MFLCLLLHGLELVSGQVMAIATSLEHTCVIMVGTQGIRCWGANGDGQLGYNDNLQRTTFPATNINFGGYMAKQLSLGRRYSCALSTVGGVQCWGWNGYGQLGTGNQNGALKPNGVIAMPGGAAVTHLSANHFHTCVVLAPNGAVHCWGWNNKYQCGYGDDVDKLSVPSTAVTTGALEVGTGYWHTCILTTAYNVKCWGNDQYGQIGIGGSASTQIGAPASNAVTGVSNLVVGVFHNCYVKGTAARCWGSSQYGELGYGSMSNPVFTPGSVGDLNFNGATPAVVAAGIDSHSCECAWLPCTPVCTWMPSFSCLYCFMLVLVLVLVVVVGVGVVGGGVGVVVVGEVAKLICSCRLFMRGCAAACRCPHNCGQRSMLVRHVIYSLR